MKSVTDKKCITTGYAKRDALVRLVRGLVEPSGTVSGDGVRGVELFVKFYRTGYGLADVGSLI